MGTGRTDEFCKGAVRIVLTSGLSRRRVADDLGVGFSTLNKWVSAHRDTDVVSAEDHELARENERLRREVRILKEGRVMESRKSDMGVSCAMRPLFRSDTKEKEQKKNRRAVALALRWRWRTITCRGLPHKDGLGPMPGGAALALAVPRRAK
jgi:transposase